MINLLKYPFTRDKHLLWLLSLPFYYVLVFVMLPIVVFKPKFWDFYSSFGND